MLRFVRGTDVVDLLLSRARQLMKSASGPREWRELLKVTRELRF